MIQLELDFNEPTPIKVHKSRTGSAQPVTAAEAAWSINEAILLIHELPNASFRVGSPKIIFYEISKCRDIIDLLKAGEVSHRDVLIIIEELEEFNIYLNNAVEKMENQDELPPCR